MDSAINRRLILVAIIIVAILLIGGLFLFLPRNTANTPNTQTPLGEVFPSGDSRPITNQGQETFPPLANDVITIATSSLINSNTAEQLGGNDFIGTTPYDGRFKNIVSTPIAAATILPNATNTILYIDQASGNIYSTSLVGGVGERLSITTITGVREVVWGKEIDKLNLIIGQDNLLGRTFSLFYPSDDVTNNLLNFTSSSTNQYYNFTVNPNANKIISLARTSDGVGVYESNFKLIKPTLITTLLFGDWRLSWPNPDIVALETKPSALVPGSLYFLNLKTKSLTKILGGLSGLTSLVSPNNNYIIYSNNSSSGLETYLYDLKNKQVKLLPFATLADKCVWSHDSKIIFCASPTTLPRGQYPDDWFKGIISTTDDFWRVETSSSTAKLLAPGSSIGPFDASYLLIDNANETVLFTNKLDSSLWSFDVRESF